MQKNRLRFAGTWQALGYGIILWAQLGTAQVQDTGICKNLLMLERNLLVHKAEMNAAPMVKLSHLLCEGIKHLGVQTQAAAFTKPQALQFLQRIDSFLAQQGFFTCLQIELLSECLTPIEKNQFSCQLQLNTNFKKTCFDRHSKVYLMDCDLGSFLYLGLAEVLSLPLQMVEVPHHNFVRWHFENGDYLNWDVNTAESYSDSMYRKGRTPAIYQAFDKEEEHAFNYLKSMSTAEVRGYYAWVIGRRLKREHRYVEARAYYAYALQNRPYHPVPKLCMAYLLTFQTPEASKQDLLLANQLAFQAKQALPDNYVGIETLACSYARLGNYEAALKTALTSPKQKPELIQAFSRKKDGVSVYHPVD